MKRTNIHVERARNKITQNDLAKEVNVTRQSIHSIESGKWSPGVYLAIRIAKYFNVDVEYLFKLED